MEFNQQTILFAVVITTQIVTLVLAIRKPNERQDVSIAKIEEQLKSLNCDVTLIKANHLPHIEKEVRCINEKLAGVTALLNLVKDKILK